MSKTKTRMPKRLIALGSSNVVKNRHIMKNSVVHIRKQNQFFSDARIQEILGPRVVV